jgi:hypothetical protein
MRSWWLLQIQKRSNPAHKPKYGDDQQVALLSAHSAARKNSTLQSGTSSRRKHHSVHWPRTKSSIFALPNLSLFNAMYAAPAAKSLRHHPSKARVGAFALICWCARIHTLKCD